ncbi:class I SAM-dependent methyltransferase [Pseudomonas sp. PDM15]|uniref:class I SAM-dependent methyltransferase n=1 Tax=Pseudomonas sp. PDM15 TaxID=2769303 RepID=UPI0017802312|nr:class I SAM-dependent methyltransferase [Pseudomonas sp. PDM15]MBD9426149.1 class I SAM-dependent methyltransferase [Pseudomonas sp. PDM15]
MNQFELFRRLAGLQGDPRDDETIWREAKQAPGFVDSRNCGLIDAVQSGWYQSQSDELFKGFPVGAEDSVLDVGCGAGGATLFCANRGAAVTFTDVVAEKIESLRQRVARTPARHSEGLVVDSTRLPLADACMTRVISMEVLEHVDDPQAFMCELARVGQSGALYLLAVPDPVGEQMQRGFAPDSYFQSPNHIHIFEREQFGQLVLNAGLEIVERSSFGFFWTVWMFMYWVLAKHAGAELEGASHDIVQPPYPPLLNDWAKLWQNLIQMPEAAPMKQALDQLLPKSQVIIARKP